MDTLGYTCVQFMVCVGYYYYLETIVCEFNLTSYYINEITFGSLVIMILTILNPDVVRILFGLIMLAFMIVNYLRLHYIYSPIIQMLYHCVALDEVVNFWHKVNLKDIKKRYILLSFFFYAR